MIGVVLLPQLLFFWLAPQDAAARWAVYIVGTVLTFLLTCMSFGVCWYVGVRRGAAMAAVSGVFDAAVVGVCAALLASDASVRDGAILAGRAGAALHHLRRAAHDGAGGAGAGRTPPRAGSRGADAPALRWQCAPAAPAAITL